MIAIRFGSPACSFPSPTGSCVLRERLTAELTPRGIALRYPPVAYCTDNAAMIAAAGYFHLRLGERSGLDLDVRPNLQLPFAVTR